MGSINRKFEKKKKLLMDRNVSEKLEEVQKKVKDLQEKGKYQEALDVLASEIELGSKKAEFLYLIAYSYFMLNEYERSVKWINNTISLDGTHVKARILLASICLVSERVTEGFSIFEFIFEHYEGILTIDERDDIGDILKECTQEEKKLIIAEFPYINKFMRFDLEKEEIFEKEESFEEDDSDEVEALLKDALEEVEKIEEKEEAEKDTSSNDVQSLIDEIMARPVSLSDKVKILNSFAGGYYMSLDFESAHAMLEAAVKIDTENEYTLRNMSYLLLAEGKSDEAMEWATKLPMTDFALLYFIQCQG